MPGGRIKFEELRLPILILISACFLYFRLGSWGVTETSEARYAQISEAMSKSGDWIHPELLGIYHYHKPPVVYLLTAAVFKLADATAFWARFLLQIAVLIQVILVYKISIHWYRCHDTAFYAAVIYLCFPLVIISTRALTTDAYLCTFCLLAIFSWLKYHSQAGITYLHMFATAIGLGFLTKGPMILVVLPVILIHSFGKPPPEYSAIQKYLALAMGLIIGFSWFALVVVEEPGLGKYFVEDHVIKRYLDPNHFGRSKPFWFYLVLVPLTSFPWIMIIAEYLLRRKSSYLEGHWPSLWCWIVIPILFFSFSASKLILYVLPIYAGLALAAAKSLRELAPDHLIKWHKAQFYFYVAVLLILWAVTGNTAWNRPFMTILLFVTALVALVWLNFGTKAIKMRILVSGYVFIAALTMGSTYILSANPLRTNSTSTIAGVIKKQYSPGKSILIYNRLTPSLAFNLKAPLISLQDGHPSLDRETQFQADSSWKDGLLNLNSPTDSLFLQELLNHKPILVAKSELPDHRKWLVDWSDQKYCLGSWKIYY